MKQKTSLNIKKRVFAGIAVSALALATVAGAVNFGTIADAARGVLDNTAEYGEQLKDHAPADLDLTELQGSSDTWYWVDGKDTYFGKPGDQKFVVANANLNNGETPTAYKEVTVPVRKRSVVPIVKQGTIPGTAVNYTTTAKASIGAYKRTITVTAGEGGTITLNNSEPSTNINGTYVIGELITLTAAPAEGYKFTGWSDGDDSNPRTITVNDNTTYTATFEDDSMKVTAELPKPGNVSIMTLEQAYVALGGSISSGGYQYDPTQGYNSSTYYIYAINDTAGTNDALTNSTSTNLKTVNVDWYRELNKPTTYGNHWTVGSYKLFGGPLCDIYHGNNDMYRLSWYYSGENTHVSSSSYCWGHYVSGSAYVAIINAANTMLVTSTLPTKLGDVSIMTLEQAYIALGGSTSTTGYKFDPTKGYDTSTYYIYAINDIAGTNDAVTNSTSTNLKAVGIDGYKQLNKFTTYDNHWTVGDHKIFGGLLDSVYRSSDDIYSFCWYYSESDNYHSDSSCYWNDLVSASIYVAVVCANNSMTVTPELPTISGNVSIMTLEQLYVALGGSTSTNGSKEDPGAEHNTSTYYVYAINDTNGTNDAITNSTSANLQKVGIDWYKQFNKSTENGKHWTVDDHALFGGPFYKIFHYNGDTYYFYFYVNNYASGSNSNYWSAAVSPSVYVAVVRS